MSKRIGAAIQALNAGQLDEHVRIVTSIDRDFEEVDPTELGRLTKEPSIQPVEQRHSVTAHSRRPRWQAVLSTGLIVVLFAGVTWGGWTLLSPRALLQDNFNDEWCDTTKWWTPRQGIREQDGHLWLISRGYLVTADEFPGPVSLTFDWKWVDLGDDPHYADHLSIVLRTTAEPRPYPHEVLDGLMVKVNTSTGRISIELPSGDPAVRNIERIAETDPATPLPMPADKWHTIRVTYNSGQIAVYITGPEIAPRYAETPVLQASCADVFPGNNIAIYNRELVGGIPHVSHIDNVVLRELGQETLMKVLLE